MHPDIETGEKPFGRPPKYKPEFPEQAKKLCALGATDADLADFFDVSIRTIDRWKVEHQDFCQAVKLAKEIADDRIERSLYQRAVGYQTDAVKIFQYEGKELVVPYREQVQPDTTACIFWLKNRKPKEWRDRIEQEHTHKVEFTAQLEDFLRALSGDRHKAAIEKPAVDAEFEQIVLQNDNPPAEQKE